MTIVACIFGLALAYSGAAQDVPEDWRRFNTFDAVIANSTYTYSIWYYGGDDWQAAYSDAQNQWGNIEDECGKQATIETPGSEETKLYWGLYNARVGLYSSEVVVNNGTTDEVNLQKCISKGFTMGSASGAAVAAAISFLALAGGVVLALALM